MQSRFISIFLVMAIALNAQSDRMVGDIPTGSQIESIKVEIKNIGDLINSPFVDYAPLISADGSILVFTSRKPLTENKTRNLKDYIYYSNFDKNKRSWSDALPFSSTINNSGRNNSAISISNNGQHMLIYRDDLNTNGDIFESHLEGWSWTEPMNMGEPINSPDKEPSACISPDGGTIFFVSDRKGGLGGFDIWYCKKDGFEKWGEAINIGAPINSVEDEDGLFFHSDGKTLFFSSKGHNSLGGYDIFMSELDPATNIGSVPKNLGPSINTNVDDLYFVLEANGKTGYYSSNRDDGLGENDIYRIDFLEDFMKTNMYLLKGRVLDKNGNPIKSKITVIDKSTGSIIGSYSSNAATGKYLITLPANKSYDIEIDGEGYSYYGYSSESSNQIGFKEIEKVITLESKKPSKISKTDKVAAKNSEKAKETPSVSKSVSPAQSEFKSTIFGKVLDENENPLKVQIDVIDNNTNKVIGKYQTSASTGEFIINLKEGNYRLVFSKLCYLFKSVNIPISNFEEDKKELKNILMEQTRAGKKIVLDNILFDYSKATLGEESFLTLDNAIRLMNNLESLEVEISGHTDNSGSAVHNQKLSEERAREVMKYLVRMGIDEERLKYKGYGLSQPFASNDSEIGRQLNRRTELKVIAVDLEVEHIKEIKRLKEYLLSQEGKKPEKISLPAGQQQNSGNLVPDRFKQYDTKNRNSISFTEILPFIDSFLEGNNKVKAEEIIALIDYYFEQ